MTGQSGEAGYLATFATLGELAAGMDTCHGDCSGVADVVSGTPVESTAFGQLPSSALLAEASEHAVQVVTEAFRQHAADFTHISQSVTACAEGYRAADAETATGYQELLSTEDIPAS